MQNSLAVLGLIIVNKALRNKVLHIAFDTLANGGVTSVIMSIISSLHKDAEFSVLCYNKPAKHRVRQLNDNDAKLFIIRPTWAKGFFEFFIRPFVFFFSCISTFRQEKFDVVHCHDSSEGGVILLAAKLCGVKKRIMHSHNTKSPVKRKNPIVGAYRWMQRRLFLSCANVFVGCSENACIDLFGNRQYKVINNSIELSKFYCSQSEKSSKYRFIHIGRMTYQKNQMMVLKVFSEILKSIPDATLTLIGEGEDLSKIKNAASNLNISSVVEFLPANSNIAKELKKSDFMIFPSIYEGFGIVLIEAQSANVVCFASDVCPRSTDVGLCDYLSLTDSPKAWADHIMSFIKSDKKHTVDIEKLKTYDSKYIANEYKALYE